MENKSTEIAMCENCHKDIAVVHNRYFDHTELEFPTGTIAFQSRKDTLGFFSYVVSAADKTFRQIEAPLYWCSPECFLESMKRLVK